MTAFNTILLAVEQSRPSDRAVETARELALLGTSAVPLLHIREIEMFVGKSGGRFELETDADVDELVSKEVAVLRDAHVKCTVGVRRVHKADVARTIVERADDLTADVIVMGSRGHSAFSALMLGCTAYEVLHATRRPVLIIP